MGKNLSEAQFDSMRRQGCYRQCMGLLLLVLLSVVLAICYVHYVQKNHALALKKVNVQIAKHRLKRRANQYTWIIVHRKKLMTLEQRHQWTALVYRKIRQLMLYPGRGLQIQRIVAHQGFLIIVQLHLFRDIKVLRDYLQQASLFGLCRMSEARALAQGGYEVNILCQHKR